MSLGSVMFSLQLFIPPKKFCLFKIILGCDNGNISSKNGLLLETRSPTVSLCKCCILSFAKWSNISSPLYVFSDKALLHLTRSDLKRATGHWEQSEWFGEWRCGAGDETSHLWRRYKIRLVVHAMVVFLISLSWSQIWRSRSRLFRKK